jgi:hypothetical protein
VRQRPARLRVHFKDSQVLDLDWGISIMAISMHQCDYILVNKKNHTLTKNTKSQKLIYNNISRFNVQDKDYETVIGYLFNHIPKIYDESLDPDHEIVIML